MFNKVSRAVFSALFLAMLIIPLVTTNLKDRKVSVAENRRLAAQAHLRNSDGTLNENFTADFETWINDNIGQRSSMVLNNAKIQFHVFNVLSNNSNMYLGPYGELNYATEDMLKDYQHANLYNEDRLKLIADSMQCLSDYVENRGAPFFYFQCWDKHSIYPEYFPTSVVQTGDVSKTDGIIKALLDYTNVKVISPKQDLLDVKSVYPTYSVWGDASHWNPRGAYIGYLKLMEAINANSDIQYRVLQESDYNITTPDQGSTLFGGIHRVDYIEQFDIREPKAVLTDEKLASYSVEDERHHYYTNNAVDNDTRLLVIGDSYFNNFIMDDLAESFHETIIVWGNYLDDIQAIMDAYDPDIVVVEAAERVDRTRRIISAVEVLQQAATSSSDFQRETGKQEQSVEEAAPDVDDSSARNPDGYVSVAQEFDKAGNVVQEQYRDVNGNPVDTPMGYAEIRRNYDARGRVVSVTLFDANGAPCVLPGGYSGYEQTYDDNGKLASRRYTDGSGNAVLRTDGYAEALWTLDEPTGSYAVSFVDASGNTVRNERLNMIKDGPYEWSAWMTPEPNMANRSFRLATLNLGDAAEGDVYTCQVEIEFRNVSATPGQSFGFRAQGAADHSWDIGNVWNRNLVSLGKAPDDGVYLYTSTQTVPEAMTGVSNFDIGLRCDNWATGSFRVRLLKVEKGDTATEWTPGI